MTEIIKSFQDYCDMCGDMTTFNYKFDHPASNEDGEPIVGIDHVYWSKCGCNWALSIHEDQMKNLEVIDGFLEKKK